MLYMTRLLPCLIHRWTRCRQDTKTDKNIKTFRQTFIPFLSKTNYAPTVNRVSMKKVKFCFTMLRIYHSVHLPIHPVSSASAPGTSGQTGPDCPLKCELWMNDLVWHSPLQELQLLHTWIPPFPTLYLQNKKQKLCFMSLFIHIRHWHIIL